MCEHLLRRILLYCFKRERKMNICFLSGLAKPSDDLKSSDYEMQSNDLKSS